MPTPRETYLKKLEGKKRFLQGDEACSYGAIYGGCTFFGGYPITPASEIAEVLAREMPRAGSYYVQFEDEIASIAAVVGAALMVWVPGWESQLTVLSVELYPSMVPSVSLVRRRPSTKNSMVTPDMGSL